MPEREGTIFLSCGAKREEDEETVSSLLRLFKEAKAKPHSLKVSKRWKPDSER